MSAFFSKLQNFPATLADWWSQAHRNPLFLWGVLGAAVLLLADQASKYWIVYVIDLPSLRTIDISRIFDLTYVENRGMSFGLLPGARVFLSLVSTGVAIGLIWWLGRLTRPIAAIGVAFIVGGALGNLYDRIAYGYVVDFFDFSGLGFPWVFNIADASINVGIAFLLYDAWQTRDQDMGKDAGGSAPGN